MSLNIYDGFQWQSLAADRAIKLETPRTISLSGVTATSQSFDGTANIDIPILAVPYSLLTNVPIASDTVSGIVTNSTQTIAGNKTFTGTNGFTNSIVFNTPISGSYARGILYRNNGIDNAGIGEYGQSDNPIGLYLAIGTTTPWDQSAGLFITQNDITWKGTSLATITQVNNANVATASRLTTPRTITLSGNVTGSAQFDGSANITISTTISNYLPLSGGSMTGNITIPATSMSWIGGKDSAPIQQDMSSNTNSYFPIIRQKQSSVTYNIGGLDGQFGIYMYQNSRTEDGTDASLKMDSSGNISATGTFTASRVYNAVYNDYAECFKNSNLIYKGVLHRIVEIDDNECVRLATKNSYRVIGVVSDNYGHLLGGTEDEIDMNEKIPVGLAGTLYVYTLDDIDTNNIGKFVCADNNGYATVASKNSEGTIVGKIIGFNLEYHQYKILLILK